MIKNLVSVSSDHLPLRTLDGQPNGNSVLLLQRHDHPLEGLTPQRDVLSRRELSFHHDIEPGLGYALPLEVLLHEPDLVGVQATLLPRPRGEPEPQLGHAVGVVRLELHEHLLLPFDDVGEIGPGEGETVGAAHRPVELYALAEVLPGVDDSGALHHRAHWVGRRGHVDHPGPLNTLLTANRSLFTQSVGDLNAAYYGVGSERKRQLNQRTLFSQ